MKNINKAIVTAAALLLVAAAVFKLYPAKEQNMTDLSKTNPEFAAMWNNFINHDVAPQSSLDVKTVFLVRLVSAVAAQGNAEFELLLNQALDNGLTPTEALEAVYQTVPYAGMAKARDFIIAANKIFAAKGVKLPLANQSTTTPENRLEKGISVQSDIFGAEHISSMRANAPAELKHLQDFLSANCFGDYYTRGGLDIKTRELLTFVTIVSMGGADPQAKAHAAANMSFGNDKKVLIDAVTQILPIIGYPRSLNALAAINEVSK